MKLPLNIRAIAMPAGAEKSLLPVLLLPLLMAPSVLVDMYDLPKSLALLIIAVLLSARAIWRPVHHESLRLNYFDILLLGLIGWLTVSTLLSINPSLSLLGFYKRREGLLSWFAYAAVYFEASRLCLSGEAARRVTTWLIGFSIPISLYAVAQHFGLDLWNFAAYDTTRAFSTTGNPLYLGAYLTLVLPLSAAYVYAGPHRARILGAPAFCAGLAALLFSYARAAWLTSALAMGALFLWFLFRSIRHNRFIGVALILLVLPLGALSLSSRITDRVSSSFVLSRGTTASRLEIWRLTPQLIRLRPLTGWGLETFQSTFTRYRSKRYVKLEGALNLADRPHNQTLYMAYAAGLPGLALYLLLVGASIKLGADSYRRADVDMKLFYLGTSLAVGAYWLQEQFSFSTVGVTPIAWLLLGVLASGANKRFSVRLPNFRSPAARQVAAIAGIVVVSGTILTSASLLWADHLFSQALANPDPIEAAAPLELAVRLDPFENVYRSMLAKAYMSAGLRSNYEPHIRRAVAVAAEAAARDPWDPAAQLLIGDGLQAVHSQGSAWNKADLSRAEKAYLRAVYLDPYLAGAWLQLGLLYTDMNQTARSRRALRAALRIDPQFAEARRTLNRLE